MEPWYKVAVPRKEVEKDAHLTRMNLPSTWSRLSPEAPPRTTGIRGSSFPAPSLPGLCVSMRGWRSGAWLVRPRIPLR